MVMLNVQLGLGKKVIGGDMPEVWQNGWTWSAEQSMGAVRRSTVSWVEGLLLKTRSLGDCHAFFHSLRVLHT
jgi:hypothetical protein